MFNPKRDETLLLWFRGTTVEAVRRGYDDLTIRQLAILLIIYGDDEKPTVRGLASQLRISRPAVSRVLDRLCGKGLARRMTDPRDRRSILVRRTPHGSRRLLHLQSLMAHAARSDAVVQTVGGQGGARDASVDWAAPRQG